MSRYAAGYYFNLNFQLELNPHGGFLSCAHIRLGERVMLEFTIHNSKFRIPPPAAHHSKF